MNEAVILGLDFLRKLNAFVDFKTNKLGLRDNCQVYELNYIEETVTAVKVEKPSYMKA